MPIASPLLPQKANEAFGLSVIFVGASACSKRVSPDVRFFSEHMEFHS